jgi:O-antigen/teichoic acid export membrane protein
MKEHFKKLAGDGLIYGLSGIIARFVSIFIIPIYTRYFPPEEFAIINLINVAFVAISILVVLGLDNSVALWYWEKEDVEERKKTFASWFWFLFLTSFAVLLTVVLSGNQMSLLLLQSKEYKNLLLLAGLSFFFNSFSNVYSNWLKIQRKAMATVLFTLVISIGNIACAIYLVAYLHLGIEGVFLAQLLVSVVSFLYVIIAMRHWIHWKYFCKKRLKEMLHFSLPLIPAAFCSWLISSAGIYFIQYFESKYEVGLYQIGNTIATIVSLATYAFINAWTPLALSMHKKDYAKSFYSSSFIVFLLYASTVLVALFLFVPEILYLFTSPNYYPAALVAGLLGLNLLVSSTIQIVSIGSAIAKNNKSYSKAVVMGAVLTVLGYVVLVPFWGKEGSAVASIVSTLITVILVYRYSQKLYFIPYNLSKVIPLILVCAVFCTFSVSLNAKPFDLLLMIVKGGAFLMYVVLILALFRKDLMFFLTSKNDVLR